MAGRASPMSRRALLLAAILSCLVAPTPSHARRQPSSGGRVQVALPDPLRGATRDALLLLPLAEADDAALSPTVRAARPLVPGTQVRSHVLDRIDTADDGVSWMLTPHGVQPDLLESVRACLSTTTETPGWPRRALAAAGVSVSVRADGADLRATFSAAVSVLPQLLTGCWLRSPAGPTGAFEEGDGGVLVARPDASGGPPLLHAVSLGDPGSPADVTHGDPLREGGSLLVATWPDVLLLVLDGSARASDPLGLGDAGDALVRFQRELAPELLLAVAHGGRGAGTRSLLPPGVGPDGPPPGARELSPPQPLQLRALSEDAPRLALRVASDDRLALGVADRLALLLRARGWATDRTAEAGPTAQIVRWRPPVADAGLALLVLGDLLPGLVIDPADAGQLLAGTASERASAALTLERAWISERRVVPLLTASRWLVLHPLLRGVRIRGDGVPLLDDASWTAP